MKTRFILSLLIAVLISGSSTAKGTKTLYVADHMVACAGNYECIQIREKSSVPYRVFSDTIQGFTYEEGYEYKLSVKALETLNTLSGFYEERYQLLKVVSKKKTNYNPSDKLADKKWIMKSMDDTKRTIGVPDTSGIFIVFNVKGGTANGKGVCNTFHASVNFLSAKITFSNFANTKMLCKGQAFENVVFNFFKSATTFKVQGNLLTLWQPNGSNIILEAREITK